VSETFTGSSRAPTGGEGRFLGVEATVPAEQTAAVEPCAHCGAPLASDQRYCLECGAPRTYLSGLHQLDGMRKGAGGGHSSRDPHAPPSHQIGVGTPYDGPPTGAQPSAHGGSRWGGGPTGLIAGVGVLLLAMGVGVLIGRSGGDSGKAAVAPPQVITVEQSGAGTGAAPSTGSPTPTPSPAKHGTKKTSSKHGSQGSSHTSSSSTGNSLEKPAPASVLKNLKSKSGGDYEQKSKNLPNVIETK
jgi:hypothetical protein